MFNTLENEPSIDLRGLITKTRTPKTYENNMRCRYRQNSALSIFVNGAFIFLNGASVFVNGAFSFVNGAVIFVNGVSILVNGASIFINDASIFVKRCI